MFKTHSENICPTPEQMWLLKACLLSDQPAKKAWQNWIERVDFENVDPACYKLLPLVFRNPALTSLEDPVFLKCQGIYRQTWVANQILWKKITPTLKELLDAGVEKIILLKGMAMILHYYRDFGARVIGDIDILVRKNQLPTIEPIIRSLGWQQNVSRFDLNNQEHLNRWHALNLKLDQSANLDLHWSFIQENCPKLDEAVIHDAIPSGRFYVPNPTDLLLQTCVHGMKYSPVPLIRWIADAMMILEQSEKQMDWKRLVDLARKAQISLPLSAALNFLAEQFNAPIPQKTLQELKGITPTRLESLEHKCNLIGYGDAACWYRYCINQGHLSRLSRILHAHNYLRVTARLRRTLWIPFFAVYWILKRLYRLIHKCK